MHQDQNFTFDPTVWVTLSFPRAIEYPWRIRMAATVDAGNAASITFRAGNIFSLVPAGLRDPMTITPSFFIRNTFSADVTNRFREDIVLTVGQFEPVDPERRDLP